MKRLYLIRHAQAQNNTDADMHHPNHLSPLTHIGQLQAQQLARSLDVHFDVILASRSVRAHETAKIINRQKYDLIVDPLFSEWLDCDADASNPLTKAERQNVHAISWEGYDPHKTVHDKGESFSSLWARCQRAEEMIRKIDLPSIALVSHATFIRAMKMRHLERAPPATPHTMSRFHKFIQENKVAHALIDPFYILNL